MGIRIKKRIAVFLVVALAGTLVLGFIPVGSKVVVNPNTGQLSVSTEIVLAVSTTKEPVSNPVGNPPMTWYDSNYTYKRAFNITNTTAGAQTDYQMELLINKNGTGGYNNTVNLSGHCQSDFDDIRFTNSSETGWVNYWAEESSSGDNITVWIELDSISATGNTTFYIYYGNNGASSASNGTNTFILFNSGDTVVGWTDVTVTGQQNIDWAVNAGKIRATAGANGAGAFLFCDTQTGINNWRLHADIIAQDGLTAANYQQGFAHKTTQASAGNGQGRWLDISSYDKWAIKDESSGQTFSSADTGFDASDTHKYILTRFGNDSKLYVDDALKVSHTKSSWLPQYIGLYAYMAVTNHWVDFSNIFVTKYVEPEPAWGEWGSEETSVSAPNITNTPTSYNFGNVIANATHPTGLTTFNVTNNGDCAVNISIKGTNMTSGSGDVGEIVTTTDWKTPGTCTNVDRDSKNNWTDVNYTKVSDNNRTTCNIEKEDYGDWLRCTNFGFTTGDVPVGVTIAGIEVMIERKAFVGNYIKDSALYLRNSTEQIGDNRTNTTAWTTSDVNVTYGASNDTWNTTLTDSDVRDSSFGIDFSAQNTWDFASTSAYIDCVSIRLHYSRTGMVLDSQVAASTDDGFEKIYTNGTHEMNTTYGGVGHLSNTATLKEWGGHRWVVSIPKGATIYFANVSLHDYWGTGSSTEMYMDIHFELNASPAQFQEEDDYDISNRTRTSASVLWEETLNGTGWISSPDLSTPLQELVDAYSVESIVLIAKPKDDAFKVFDSMSYDGNVSEAAKLHVEYSGTSWELSNTATPGADIYGLKAGIIEDFTTYNETDPNNHIELVGTNHIDFEAHTDEDAYLYTVGNFSDFSHEVDIKPIQASATSSDAVPWLLSNAIDDGNGLNLANEDHLNVLVGYYNNETLRISLWERYGSSSYWSEYYYATFNTSYYLSLNKTGTSLTCDIYSDISKETLLAERNLSLHSDYTFQYIFAANTLNSGLDRYLDIDIENLNLNEYNTVVKRDSPYNNLCNNLAVNATQSWGLELYAPTSFSDYNEKTGTVTLTATEA